LSAGVIGVIIFSVFEDRLGYLGLEVIAVLNGKNSVLPFFPVFQGSVASQRGYMSQLEGFAPK